METTFKAYVLNLRFDTMEGENGKNVDWAHLYFAGEPRYTDNFVGSDVAKLRVDPADNNKLAKRLIALLGENFPAQFEVECGMRIVSMEPKLVCIGLKLIS